MGPLAAVIYKRIFNLKILSALQIEGGPLNFLKPVLEYYETYSMQQDPKALKKVHTIIGVIPSLKELQFAISARDPKENLVYKIVLDVLGKYLKESDSPSFKVCLSSSHTMFTFRNTSHWPYSFISH